MMATSSVDDSQVVKKRRLESVNYALCLKCQKPGGTLVHEPETRSYERFLECIKQRAVYGDLEYVSLNELLQNVHVDELARIKATWHKECYKSTTNKTNIERLRVRYQKSLSSGSVLPPPSKGRPRGSNTKITPELDESTSHSTGHFHRSSASAYNKEDCFFCGIKDSTDLHQIRSWNAGNQLRAAVDASGNMQWKVQLSSAWIQATHMHMILNITCIAG